MHSSETFWLLLETTIILTMTSFTIACTSFYLHLHLFVFFESSAILEFWVYACGCCCCCTTKTVMWGKRICIHITHVYTRSHTGVYQRPEEISTTKSGRAEKLRLSHCSIHGCWLSAIISHNTCDDYSIRKCVYYPEIITMKFMGQTKEWMQTVTPGGFRNIHIANTWKETTYHIF